MQSERSADNGSTGIVQIKDCGGRIQSSNTFFVLDENGEYKIAIMGRTECDDTYERICQ